MAVVLLVGGVGIGYYMQPVAEAPEQTGNVPNPAYEYMVAAAAWQTSAEAHALMMQGFHVAQSNIDDMVALANEGLDGYSWDENHNLMFEG